MRLLSRKIGVHSALLLLSLSALGCAPLGSEVQVSAKISRVCRQYGIIKTSAGIAIYAMKTAVPATEIIALGIDVVCANPDHFAHDAKTVEWLIQNVARK